MNTTCINCGHVYIPIHMIPLTLQNCHPERPKEVEGPPSSCHLEGSEATRDLPPHTLIHHITPSSLRAITTTIEKSLTTQTILTT